MTTNEFPDAANPVKAKRMLENIQARYERGHAALRAESGNPVMSTRRFAESRNLPVQQIRRDKQFAQVFTESELVQVCQLRQPNGMPLQWGHLSKVFALPNRKARLAWLKKAARNGWPADVLSRQIVGTMRQSGRHGRGIKPPISVEDGLNQLVRHGELWLRRLAVVVDFINETASTERPSKTLAGALEGLLESQSAKQRQELLKELRPVLEELGEVLARLRNSCTSATTQKLQRITAKGG